MSKKLKCVSLLLALSILFSFPASANETLSVSDYVNTPDWATAQTIAPNNAADLNLGGKSIILIEETTGKVLYERDADTKLPPASITKIMTLLLTMEALENGKFSPSAKRTLSYTSLDGIETEAFLLIIAFTRRL